MRSEGSKDVMEIVEGGCRGTTKSRMGKLCQLQNNCVLKLHQVRLPLVTQNKKNIFESYNKKGPSYACLREPEEAPSASSCY